MCSGIPAFTHLVGRVPDRPPTRCRILLYHNYANGLSTRNREPRTVNRRYSAGFTSMKMYSGSEASPSLTATIVSHSPAGVG